VDANTAFPTFLQIELLEYAVRLRANVARAGDDIVRVYVIAADAPASSVVAVILVVFHFLFACKLVVDYY
jgi:hypothetical protein